MIGSPVARHTRNKYISCIKGQNSAHTTSAKTANTFSTHCLIEFYNYTNFLGRKLTRFKNIHVKRARAK